MKFSIFGASDTTTTTATSPAKPEEQVPKVEEKVDEAAEEARGGEEPTVEQKEEEEDQREKEEEPPREEDVVEDKKEEDDAAPATSTLTGSATASLTADGKSTYLAFLEETHKNGSPSTAGRGRKKSAAATGSSRRSASRSSRSRSRSTRRSRSRSTRQEKRSMSKNNKAKKETAPAPAREAEAPKEERRSRSLSPRKLVGSFRKSKKDQAPPPPSSSSSSTKEVAMPDMTTADGKSAYLAYLEATHKASVGGSKKKRSSSRSRSRSRPQKSATTEKPKRRSLSPRRKSNRIYAKPSPKATKKDLPSADKQSTLEAASAPEASVAPAVVDGKSEYLAFLEANHKMGSSGKKPSGGGGGSKRNLFRSKSKRSARSVPVDTDAIVEEATTKKDADAPVYVETEAVNLDDGTKKGTACDESQPMTDDSFVEPEELKDMAIANMDTPVLSNIAEAATDDETTTSAPSTAQVEQETELTKSGFFDSILDCTSMGFCLAGSKSPATVISEDLMPAEDK